MQMRGMISVAARGSWRLTAYCDHRDQHLMSIQSKGVAHLPWIIGVHPVDDLVRILGYNVMTLATSSDMSASTRSENDLAHR